MLKPSNALYLLTLLINAIVEAKNVDADQQQSIMCLHRLTQRLLKQFSRRYNDKHFKDLRKSFCVSGSDTKTFSVNFYRYSLLLLFTEMFKKAKSPTLSNSVDAD